MSEDTLRRARLLMQIERHEDAARELTRVLATDPESVDGHALLALAQARLERYEDATMSARRAVGLAPDSAYAHWVLGSILTDRGRDKEALVSAREALRLDPDDPDHYALEAVCLSGLSRWRDMQAAAERGLTLDPAHVDCLNLRAHALRQLGLEDEATEALDVALAEDPDDPFTHTTYGYACLQRGDIHGALEHFREALRIAPDHTLARAGLTEALKARNPLYRPILWWLLVSSRLSGGRALLVVFGVMFGVNALAKYGPDEGLLSYVSPLILLLYVLAVWTSWVGAALFDFLLWLRSDTRDVLMPRDRFVALAVGATVLAAPVAGAVVWWCGDTLGAVLTALAFLSVAIPVSGGLALPNKKARAVGATVALACVSLSIAGAMFLALDAWRGGAMAARRGGSPGFALVVFAMLGARLSTWLLVFLGLVKERR